MLVNYGVVLANEDGHNIIINRANQTDGTSILQCVQQMDHMHNPCVSFSWLHSGILRSVPLLTTATVVYQKPFSQQDSQCS